MGGDKQLSGGTLPWTEGGGGPLKNWGGRKAALKKGSGVRVLRLGPPICQGGPKVGPKRRTVVEQTRHGREEGCGGGGGEMESLPIESKLSVSDRSIRQGPKPPEIHYHRKSLYLIQVGLHQHTRDLP